MIRSPRILRHDPAEPAVDDLGGTGAPVAPPGVDKVYLPPDLWAFANEVHPDDAEARQAFYLEQMVLNGHVEQTPDE